MKDSKIVENTEETIRVLDSIKTSLDNKKRFATKAEVKEILNNALERNLTLEELTELVCSDKEYWDEIVKTADRVKEKIFGKNIFYYTPIYFDSICINNCLYCDFRRDNPNIERKRLTFEELKKEVDFVNKQGISKIELVSSTDPKFPFENLVDFVKYVKSLDKTVLMNNRPLTLDEYKTLKKAGLGWSWLWMETYDSNVYSNYHPGKEKTDFKTRIGSYERMGAAGLNVGVAFLMGLAPDWKKEILSTLAHAKQLQKNYKIDINFGTPRFCAPVFAPLKEAPYPNTATDDKIKLMVALYRLAIRDSWINVSTRENLNMLKQLWKGGGSLTNPIAATIPGGYACGSKGGQFKHYSYSIEEFNSEIKKVELDWVL